MNFGNLEKIEELILRPSSKFSIKNTVVLGRRNSKSGNRIDCFKEDCYKSNKYTNYQYVGNLYIESSDFLVFSCKDDDTNKVNEVYSTYKHIEKIRDGFNTILKNIEDAFDVLDTGEIVLKYDYEHYVVKINNLVNNNSIQMVYDVIYDENKLEGKQYERGITIFFNEESFYTTISEEEFHGITYFINNFNLLSSSQHLKQMAYMQQIAYALELENVEMLPTEYSHGSGGKITSDRKRKIRKISSNTIDEETNE